MDGIRYLWGVDLGEVRDPSAVAVIARIRDQDRWRYILGATWILDEDQVARFRRPGADFYEGLQGWLSQWHDHPALPSGAAVPYRGHSWMVVDGTGQGRDATLRFLRSRLASIVRLTPLQIRETVNSSRQRDSGWWPISRRDLIVTLDSVRDSGRLAFVDGMPLQSELDSQLRNFRIKESADDGLKRSDRDDLAMALAMAVSLGERLAGVGPGGLMPVRYE